MKAPKRFIKFIEQEKNIDEIIDWIMAASDEEMEVSHEEMEVLYVGLADKPTGDCQGDYEYCDQVEHACAESGVYAFSGRYYHKFEDSDLWLVYEYYMCA